MARRKTARANNGAQLVPTIIEFLLDETGSMTSCHQKTVAGFNDFLSEQRSQTGSCLLTLTKFDTLGQKTPYLDLDIQMAPSMKNDWFVPGGSTNLRDTIGDRLSSLKQRLESWTVKPNVLVVVMTDGDDNASRRFSESVVSDALKAHMEDGWTFVYLGANTGALQTAKRLGFPEGNSKSFETAEIQETMKDLAKATVAYRATRDEAQVAERQFFAAQ